MAKVGKVAYKLDLPPGTLILSIFHLSQLRKAVGKHHLTTQLQRNLGADWELLVEPESALGARTTFSDNDEDMEVLTKWKGLTPMEAT